MDKSKTIRPLILGIVSIDFAVAGIIASFSFMIITLIMFLSQTAASNESMTSAIQISLVTFSVMGIGISCFFLPVAIVTGILGKKFSMEEKEYSRMAKVGYGLSLAGIFSSILIVLNIIAMIVFCIVFHN